MSPWNDFSGDVYAVQQSAAEGVDYIRWVEALPRALLALTPAEKHIICERFLREDGDTTRLKDLAAEYGVTPPRIQQISERALYKLSKELRRASTYQPMRAVYGTDGRLRGWVIRLAADLYKAQCRGPYKVRLFGAGWLARKWLLEF
jgi:hypothetical protein